MEALGEGYQGVTNEYLAAEMCRLLQKEVVIVGERPRRYPCPCCWYETLEFEKDLEVCQVCLWEDDGERELTAYSSPNHMTLRQGQVNFAEFGVCDKALVGSIDLDATRKYARAELS